MDDRSTIDAFLRKRRDQQAAFLAELVRRPSDNPPGDCAGHGEMAAGLLEGLGLEVERHPVPGDLVRENGMVSATNLVVRHRFGEGGPVIALNAHGDVVPPGEGWTKDPYGAAVEEGWMYGRGVAVSKSDFASYAFALLALREEAAGLAGTVELHLTYDEEAGGVIGPKWLLDEGITKPDLAIAAGFSYAVVNAHNGCLHLEVQIDGRSAHAAKPYTGVDALEIANRALGTLYAHRLDYEKRISAIEGIGAPQLTVGLIQGGINTNVVPDRITFRLDRRLTPEEDGESVEDELKQVIGQAVGDVPGARLTIRRILLAEPLRPMAGSEKLVEAVVSRASDVIGEPVGCQGVPLYTDARHYAAAGIPTILYGAGPRTIEEANAHRADERLPLDDLHKATLVTALALRDLLTAP
ncbi:MAG: M20/M25/M40 family metallo-hydrolase [Geminicoccaceae bacterium]